MNKKINKLIISFFLFIILFELLDHSNIVSQAILKSTKLWFYNLIPSIFPMYLFIDILLNYDGLEFLNTLLNPITKKIFHLKKEFSFVFLLSMLSGFPSNSKYIKNLLDKNLISTYNANILLFFTHFSNPLFIIETIGNIFLKNKKIGIIILISHYLGNFIIGFIHRNKFLNNSINYKKDIIKKENFINLLSNSIYNTAHILILLYGIITFFMILISLLKENIFLSPFLNSIICSLVEITSGISLISNLSISIFFKSILITFFLSFGGLCIHMQVFSILKDYNLNYFNYLKIRIVHGLISSCFFYIFFINLK